MITVRQKGRNASGIACLKSIALYFDKYDVSKLPHEANIGKNGKSIQFILMYLNELGIAAKGGALSGTDLVTIGNPIIALIKFGPFKRFVVAQKSKRGGFHIMDPGFGLNYKVSESMFNFFWSKKAVVPLKELAQ